MPPRSVPVWPTIIAAAYGCVSANASVRRGGSSSTAQQCTRVHALLRAARARAALRSIGLRPRGRDTQRAGARQVHTYQAARQHGEGKGECGRKLGKGPVALSGVLVVVRVGFEHGRDIEHALGRGIDATVAENNTYRVTFS